MKNIAVLLSSYNRKEKTTNCLKSFYNAIEKSDPGIKYDIYLVDDGSTDGTSLELKQHFPCVRVINGTGNLFWARGMRLAWETALTTNNEYDSFLLLNDDVVLSEHFINDIMYTHNFSLKNYHQPGIYVSSTQDPVNLKISYGGIIIKRKGIKVSKTIIKPSDIPIPCSMSNANILMVTKAVVKSIGIFDAKYIHQFADYDYTYTASEKGIPLLICPGIGGYCINDHGNNWLSANSSFKERIKYLYSPKGLGYKEQLYYLKKNFKYQLPYYFIMLWLKTLFPIIWDRFKKEELNQ